MIHKILGKRKQYFEFQDFAWCPKAVRDGVTDYLAFALRLVPLYDVTIPKLIELTKNENQWLDLCAGGGGGSVPLFKHVKEKNPNVELLLTDLYPNLGVRALPPGITIYNQSVDAMNVPKKLSGLRTLFTSFHHLPDPVARGVLEDAWKQESTIAVFEFTERSLHCLLMTFPTIVLNAPGMLLVPPYSLKRFFWTYIIPMIPFVATADILLSAFRTRTPEELKDMVKDMNKDSYGWEIGQIPSHMGFKITYLIGKKK